MTASVAVLTEKQGIVTILGSHMDRMGAASDMSSKIWLAQNGFSPMNRTASSTELHTPDSPSSCEGGEDSREGRRGQFNICASIQHNKNEGDKMIKVEEKEGQYDIRSSIIFQKSNEDDAYKSLPPAYVHPLVKRSKSCLSERSLEICTECLGSETGSDGFSSYPPSETGDAEDRNKEEHQKHQQSESVITHSHDAAEEEFRSVTKYNYAAASKKVRVMSFPPPLPSLSRSDGAASLRMRSVRDNGRLVVEAVSVPSQKNFHAVRQDGRLVLTFVDDCKSQEPQPDDGDEQEVECHGMEEEYEYDREEEPLEVEEVGTGDIEIVNEDAKKLSSDSMTNVHRLALMIKSYELGNRNPSWSNKFNEVVELKKADEEEDADVVKMTATPVKQSLPTSTAFRTAAVAAASLNAYEYYWWTKQTVKAKPKIFYHQESSILPRNNHCNNDISIFTKNVQMQCERKQVSVLRGKKGDYLIPMSKTCKVSRGSALFSEPYCITTS